MDGAPREHYEDSIARAVIDGISFVGDTLSSRCVMVHTDQHTGEFRDGYEPTATLATYRKGSMLNAGSAKVPTTKKNKIFFTRNFDHFEEGELVIGSHVHIEELD